MSPKSIHRCTDMVFACRSCKQRLLDEAAISRVLTLSRQTKVYVPGQMDAESIARWAARARLVDLTRRNERRLWRKAARRKRPVSREALIAVKKALPYPPNFQAPCGCWRYAKPHLRRLVYLADAGQCQFCGIVLDYGECMIDHVTPWPTGHTVEENLCVICPPCNKLKGRQTIPSHLAPRSSAAPPH